MFNTGIYEPTLEEYKNLLFDFIKEYKNQYLDQVGNNDFWVFIHSNKNNFIDFVESLEGEINKELLSDWIDCDYLENVSHHEIKINIYTSLGVIENFVVSRKFDYIDRPLVYTIARSYYNVEKINVTGWVRVDLKNKKCCITPNYKSITPKETRDNWKCTNCGNTHYSM